MDVPWDSSKAWLQLGDELTLEDLLYSLLLASGNDSAVAIAEHISGSHEEFVELMNEEALKYGATNTSFMNAHGYHDEDHYTTAYDMYLLFNQCIKDEKFVEIITTPRYRTEIVETDGDIRGMTWTQSNQFISGEYDVPENIAVLGGKTGTTDKAGACLILYVEDIEANPYVSIVMGADTKAGLYESMSALISTIHNEQ